MKKNYLTYEDRIFWRIGQESWTAKQDDGTLNRLSRPLQTLFTVPSVRICYGWHTLYPSDTLLTAFGRSIVLESKALLRSIVMGGTH